MNINTKVEIYQDKKETNLVIANAFRYLGDIKRAIRLEECGTALVFGKHQSGAVSLAQANFCRERLCPMCQWRRSLRLGVVLTQRIKNLDTTGLTPLFLTLTVKNVQGNDLAKTINEMLHAWYYKVCRRKEWKKYVKHSIRTLEVTYNRIRHTYHPHIHAIIYVKNSYFTGGKPAMTNEDFAKIWQSAMSLDYKPIVDIRAIRKEMTHTVAEVAKYCVKTSDIICDTIKTTALVVKTLQEALRGRRLISGSGQLKFNIDKEMQKLVDEQDPIADPIIELLFFKWMKTAKRYHKMELDKILS